jgi:Na+-transporting NADH:ubiquinone oxidoreductase subunit D
MAKLFSTENREAFVTPLGKNNPITVQILGICSALAVTSQLEPAIVMGLSVAIITGFSNLIISCIRNTIPNRIRIIIQLVVVATLVTIVSMVLKAVAYDVSVQLSVYVSLIITNCILMGRLEAFAMNHAPLPSFLDGLGNGLGYAYILVIVGCIRELLGSGSLLGFKFIPDVVYNAGYLDNSMMTTPAMALIIVGCVIWVSNTLRKEEK